MTTSLVRSAASRRVVRCRGGGYKVLITTPTVLATVDAIIAAAGAALVASRYGISGGGLVFISLGTFVGVWTSLLALQVQI